MKDNQGTPTVTGLVQVDVLTVLVRQNDVREALPNCRANRGEVDAKVEGSGHKCSFSRVASRLRYGKEARSELCHATPPWGMAILKAR